MPSISAPSKVLVTGANGFLAVHVVEAYLKSGFQVRGVVRSAAKGELLKALLANSAFEYVVVEDMTKDDAFDEAVKGVQAVAHTASPVAIPAGDPEIFAIRPAVQGTINLLNSVKGHGTQVGRVVITSSNVAIANPLTEKHYDETLWNDGPTELVKEKGEAAGFLAVYTASKTLAEHAVWDWVKANTDAKFDVTTLCPPWIFGPLHSTTTSKSELGASMGYLWMNVQPEKTGDALTSMEGYYIDARDLANHHVLATTTEDAGGKRLLTGARPFSWQDVYDAFQESPAIAGTPSGSQPGATKGKTWDSSYGQERLSKVLGKTREELFRPLSETFRDSIASILALNKS